MTDYAQRETQQGAEGRCPMVFQRHLGGDVLEYRIENAAGGDQHDGGHLRRIVRQPQVAGHTRDRPEQGHGGEHQDDARATMQG
ncbi:hypothetical protein D3C84_1219730 [compost metagenome]